MVALQNAIIFLVNNLGITVYQLMRYLIKYRGGDPRNHCWYEISDYDYIRVDGDNYFKKIEGKLSAEQKRKIEKAEKKAAERLSAKKRQNA